MTLQNPNNKNSEETSVAVTIVTIALLLVSYPIGVIVMWLATKWSKTTKWIVTLIGIGVMVVLGILATLVVLAINPSEQFNRAKNVQRRSDAQTLRNALESYNIENSRYPIVLKELVPTYLSEVPVDPLTNEPYDYSVLQGGRNYELCYTLEQTKETKNVPLKTCLRGESL